MEKHIKHKLKKEKNYSYIEAGEGTPIIVLHGLMGGLSNFDAVIDFFSKKDYKVLIPELPIYTKSLLKTNVKHFAKYLHDFIDFKGFKEVIILKKVSKLVTGSSEDTLVPFPTYMCDGCGHVNEEFKLFDEQKKKND